MDTNTRQLAHLVAQALEKFEAAVLTCLPSDKRREVVLSIPWIEFRQALGRLTGNPPRLHIDAAEHGTRGPKAGAILEALGASVEIKVRERSTILTIEGPFEGDDEEMPLPRLRQGYFAHLTIYANGNHQWQGDGTLIEWASEPLAHLGLGSKGAKV